MEASKGNYGKLWVSGDWNAFFGLWTNVLMNVMVLSSLMLFVVRMPAGIVFGRIIPAVGISLIVGNFYYAYMAKKLANKERREDVTALPYGPSVPHYFLVTLVIMLPVVLKTGDPVLAWRVGLVWCFIEGLIEVSGAYFGRVIRQNTPRAAMLGTLAGVSIAFISMSPAMQMMEVPWIGFISFGIILVAWFAIIPMPLRIPGGLLMIIIGTAVGWLTGYMRAEPLMSAIASFAPHLPSLAIPDLLQGLGEFAPLLSTAIPMGIYNFTEAFNNVESAAAAGDEYNVSEVIFVDGIGTLAGAVLGSPFPTAVYIGHPGWKSIGGRIGYSLGTGIAIGAVCLLGILPLALSIIPLVCVLPILVYIGAVIGAQAFQASPLKHAPAIVLALIPNFASWGKNLVDGALGTVGRSAAEVGYDKLASAGIAYKGLEVLSGGAILVGLIWGAIGAFVIDKEWNKAAIFSLLGAILSFVGIIHSGRVALAAAWEAAIGYVIFMAIFLSIKFSRGAGTGGGG
jgi:AGZA family xanthine/uracil permease-like MFS transporter